MSSSVSTASSDRRPLLAAIALFAVALVIRLFGITWGLPNDLHNDSLHPDETVVYSNYAYQPNFIVPNNYNYPSLYPIVLRITGDMVATYGGYDTLATVPPIDFTKDDYDDLKAYFVKLAPHQRATNIAGRVLNCLAGAGTAVVVFFLLLRFSGMVGALFGGLLTSIAPAFVVHSRFQTVDVFATFFFWLAILYAIKLYLNNQGELFDTRFAILAGVFAGLSTGAKYTGVIALFSVLVAILLAKRQDWLRLLALSTVACIGVFLITTPGVLLNSSQFMFGVRAEAQHMREGHDFTFAHTPHGMLYQLGNLFTGIGPLAFAVGMIGLMYGAIKTRGWMWVVLASAVVYFLLVGRSEVKFVRYGMPLIPAVCVGFGYAINGAFQRPKWRTAGVAAGVVGLLGLESLAMSSMKPSPYWACFDPRFGGLVGTLRYTQDMMKEDPRDTAARYVLNLAKQQPNSTVAILRIPWFWTVPVIKDATFLYNNPTEINMAMMQSYFNTTKDPHVDRAINEPAADYLVMTSFEKSPLDRITKLRDVPRELRGRYAELNRVLNNTKTNYDLIATFGGEAPDVEDLMHAQPKAYVYKRK